MATYRSKFRFDINASICLTGALALLLLPLRWLIAAVMAAAVHELCHIFAVKICGSNLRKIEIGAFGAVIDVLPMSRGKELLCALAGPAGGLMLLLFARWLPRVAVCAAFQSLYNLLPVYPLDGGRALRCGAALLLPPPLADGVCLWTERVVKALVLGVGIYGCCIMKLGILPLILAILLAVRDKPEKILAKKAARGYNSPTIAKRYDYDGFTKPDTPHSAEACPIYRWGV